MLKKKKKVEGVKIRVTAFSFPFRRKGVSRWADTSLGVGVPTMVRHFLMPLVRLEEVEEEARSSRISGY